MSLKYWCYNNTTIFEMRYSMSFKDKLASFFRGRYGNDKLNMALLCLCFAAVVAGSFTKWWLFALLELLLMVLILFRMLSRNIYKRSAENTKFVNLFSAVKKKMTHFFVALRDINKFRYRNCPKCHARLRLTKKRGKHTVKCPLCGEKFDVHII